MSTSIASSSGQVARFHLIDASTTIAQVRHEMASQAIEWIGVSRDGVVIGTVEWDRVRNCTDVQQPVYTLLCSDEAQLRWAA